MLAAMGHQQHQRRKQLCQEAAKMSSLLKKSN
jgi:hypothetical protein